MPRPALALMLFIAAVFLAVGLLLAVIMAPRQAAEERRLAALPFIDGERATGFPSGEEIMIAAVPEGNPSLTQYELVAYAVDEWQVTEDDEDREWVGSWSVVERVVPALSFRTGDMRFQMRPAADLVWRGNFHEFLEPADSEYTARYGEVSLPEGSRRVQGVRNRDLVTLVGQTSEDHQLTAALLFAGTRAELLEELRFGTQGLQLVGGILAAVGAIVLLIALWLARQDR